MISIQPRAGSTGIASSTANVAAGWKSSTSGAVIVAFSASMSSAAQSISSRTSTVFVAQLAIDLNAGNVGDALLRLGADDNRVNILGRQIAPPPVDVHPDGLGGPIDPNDSPMITQRIAVPLAGAIPHGQ